MRFKLIPLLAAAGALAACGAGDAASGAHQKRRLGAHVDNPWFPLKPGTVYRFKGEEDGTPTRDVVVVTHRTKLIQGAHCRVVRDRVYKHGRVVEATYDWFAQDDRGTVWYMGENTKELDRHGHVTSREGSWQSGKHGARRGIIMPAHPRVGYSARQEYYKGHAEDHFKVIRRHKRRLVTKEWTPLEKGVIDHKFYKRGVGMVAEKTVKGGDEVSRLVSISHR
jgi:hypothetical protein